jgi:hypothetical protein
MTLGLGTEIMAEAGHMKTVNKFKYLGYVLASKDANGSR